MELPEISSEQNNIIEQLSLNNNVVVDSVAGSGKTTSNLHIALHFNHKKILLLTYNSKLKIETRERVTKIGIINIEVHSYHSFCVKYYDKLCFTDSIIKKITKNKKKPLRGFNFDLIVLDEAQDITELYYELVCKIYYDNKIAKSQICIFGDKNQSIFTFNKSDQRYIEYAPNLFNFNTNEWVRCSLSVSFRITYEMSIFINKCMLKNDRIISNKISNNKPRYIICNCFSTPLDEIKYYFDLGYKPCDICVLAPSIKGQNSPVRKLENSIKINYTDVMVYVPTNDDEKLDEEILKGKLLFSSFHQIKGLERKVVMVFNFDDSYFKYYNKAANQGSCTNELYVATTRGIDHLSLFHHFSNDYLPFIDKQQLQIYCNVIIKTRQMCINNNNTFSNFNTSVTDIIKCLPYDIIDECFNQLEITQNTKYVKSIINIPLKISNDTTVESVSDINGIAIPSMFELKLKNRMSIFEELLLFGEEMVELQDINIKTITPDILLFLSNKWNAYKTGYLFKTYQITKYDWLQKSKLDECIDRINELNISIHSSFEIFIQAKNEEELLGRELRGYVDCFDEENNILYEFKCVQNLEKEHYLQLAVYMYIHEINSKLHIQRIRDNFNKNKNTLTNSFTETITKNKLLRNITTLETLLIKYKNTAYVEIGEYSIGDTIKYKIINEEIGTIYKIYKNGKITVKNENNKNVNITKLVILCLINKNIDIVKTKIIDIETELCKINKQLIEINILIEEKKQDELRRLTSILDNEIDVYSRKTEYVLFNILTNEYMNVRCDFQKLKKIVKILIQSKYVNDKHLTDDEFIKNNNKIYKQYCVRDIKSYFE